eukprot:14303391-Ditylum_brightwellii.AAC.1
MGRWFWCAICDCKVLNKTDCDFTIGCWNEHKNIMGHTESLMNKKAVNDLKRKEKAGEKLTVREKKVLNYGRKSNTMPLTAFFTKKRKKSHNPTQSLHAPMTVNISKETTSLSETSLVHLKPKAKIQTCEGIFYDYIKIKFQAKFNPYV